MLISEPFRFMGLHTRAVRGVISEGFMMIVQPTASAGATFHALVPMSGSSL